MSVHGDFDFSKVTIYLVGGAVRDYFMGIEPKDKDYVVVGSSPDEMISLGFQKVGADFPVFLHPVTKDEYALARTERKSGTGYNGFECEWEEVTIEEDLSRRDLTINSIAWDCSRDLGKVVDPFNGRQDIKDKTLRHTTLAYKEDPLRVLRTARFASSFGWKIDRETYNIMGELNNQKFYENLTPERVWLETEKALNTQKPSAYFDNLMFGGVVCQSIFPIMAEMYETKQRKDFHPEVYVLDHTYLVMDYAAKAWSDKEITFACLTHDFGKTISNKMYGNAHGHEKEGLQPINGFCDKWKVPNKYRELALLVCEYHTKVHGVLGRNDQKPTRPKSIMRLFENTSALTKPERFEKILKACEADAKGRGANKEQQLEFEEKPYYQREYLLRLLKSVKEVDTKTISKEMLAKGNKGVMIGEAIRVARIDAIRKEMRLWKHLN